MHQRVGGLFETASRSRRQSKRRRDTSAAAVKIAVRFDFNDVSVTTNSTILRLGFTIHNTSRDPVQCDPSEFSLQFPDGSVVQADQSAENKCDPDSIDPGATSKATVFFDLKGGYTGPITLDDDGEWSDRRKRQRDDPHVTGVPAPLTEAGPMWGIR